METMLCSVSGMQNKENKTQIKNALRKLEGVSQVGVNLTSGTVKIDYNDRATEMTIKTALRTPGSGLPTI
jgi:copper chaperone CopZ